MITVKMPDRLDPNKNRPATGSASKAKKAKDSSTGTGGLEPLLSLNQILVTQKIGVLELVEGWDEASKYQIFSPDGQLIYMMEEERDDKDKGYSMFLRDQNDEGINLEIKIIKKSLVVKASTTAETLGTVVKNGCCSSTEYTVFDGAGAPICLIYGHGPRCCRSGSLPLDVYSINYTKTPIGQIRVWSDLTPEIFSEDRVNFGITFPADLSVQLKAVLLGACVLIVIDKVPRT